MKVYKMQNLENDENLNKNSKRFDDVFAILTAQIGASVDEMNESIIETACEFNDDKD